MEKRSMRTLASHRKNPFQDCFPSPLRGERDHGFPSGKNQAHPEEVMRNNHAHLKSSILTACIQGKEKKRMHACTKKGYQNYHPLPNFFFFKCSFC